jgi:hypothetical protein
MFLFFIGAFGAITQLSGAAHLHKTSCTTTPQNVEQFPPHIYTPKFDSTMLYTLVSQEKNPKRESLGRRVSTLHFALLWAFALLWQ